MRSSAQIVVSGERPAIRSSITTAPATSAIKDEAPRLASRPGATTDRSGGSENNSGNSARIFACDIRYRCRDPCLTTVNRQSSEVGDDVADVIGTAVGSASIWPTQ